jgi:ActR/RegA family two-component response regulator
MTPVQPSFLLIDADSHGLEALTYGFEREGLKVTRSSELARAAQLAATGSPSGAVVALQTLTEDALRVVAELRRARPELPILALGPGSVQSAATLAGATDFLRAPSFLRDVVSVARLGLLAGRKAAEPRGRAHADEAGLRLSDYRGVFYLLRALSACGRSAILGLARGSRRAELRVYQGGLVAANVGALQSLPALHHALLWEEAALTIKLQPIPKHTMMTLTAQEVLDESERFLRDFAHGVRDLGAADTLYVVAAAAKQMQLPGMQRTEIAPLLRLFDGRRVLADVVSESPFRIFDTIRMIRRLRDAGALLMRDAKHAGAPSMLSEWAMTPDLRGVVGAGLADRRRTSRPLKPLAANPAPLPAVPAALATPAPAPMPVPRPSVTRPGRVTPPMAAAIAGHLASAPPVVVGAAQATSAPTPAADTTPAPIPAAPLQVHQDAYGSSGAVPIAYDAPAPIVAARLPSADDQPAPTPAAQTPAPTPAPIQLTQRKAAASGEIAVPPRVTPPATLAMAPTIQVKLASDGTPLTQPQAPAVAASPAPLPSESPPPPRLGPSIDPPSVPLPELGPPPERMLIPPEPRPVGEPLLPPEPTAPPPRQKTPLALHTRSKSGPREVTHGARGGKSPSGPHATNGTTTGTFDDVEADFFAREADLYKREAVETFEDLDHPLSPTGTRTRRKK